jgi:hypothetical protein
MKSTTTEERHMPPTTPVETSPRLQAQVIADLLELDGFPGTPAAFRKAAMPLLSELASAPVQAPKPAGQKGVVDIPAVEALLKAADHPMTAQELAEGIGAEPTPGVKARIAHWARRADEVTVTVAGTGAQRAEGYSIATPELDEVLAPPKSKRTRAPRKPKGDAQTLGEALAATEPTEREQRAQAREQAASAA